MLNASGNISAFGRRHGRLWSLLVALVLAAQVGLGVHQLEHRLNPDVVATDDCALCHFAAGMAAGPEPLVIAPPVLVLAAYVPLAVHVIPRQQRDITGFRSRAPPIGFSA